MYLVCDVYWPRMHFVEVDEKIKDELDPDELAHYFTLHYDYMNHAVTTSDYKRFVELQNKMARANSKISSYA